MVKHKNTRRAARRSFNPAFQVLPVDDQSVLSTLADGTVLRSSLTNLNDDFWFQSGDLTWALDGHTAGEGPIVVGIAHGDLSVVEIKEAIEAKPTSRGDVIGREQARRPVRVVGQFPGLDTNEVLNDGKPIRTPIKMYLAEGIELNMFSFNKTGAPLSTGSIINTQGVLYGNWK